VVAKHVTNDLTLLVVFNFINDCNIDITHLSVASIFSGVIHAHFMGGKVLSPGEVSLHELGKISASGWVLSNHLLFLAYRSYAYTLL
jgi:hypothetical protein